MKAGARRPAGGARANHPPRAAVAQMRITGGDARGRRLHVPAGRATRPTPARVKEALFSILFSLRGRPMGGERVLDLFAGSGALGLECLSRGAAAATFVDANPAAQACLAANIAAVGAGRRARVVRLTVATALATLGAQAAAFDLIFVDPPYAGPPLAPVLAMLKARALVAPEGLVICEHDAHSEPPTAPPGLAPITSRSWGTVALCFLGHSPSA